MSTTVGTEIEVNMTQPTHDESGQKLASRSAVSFIRLSFLLSAWVVMFIAAGQSAAGADPAIPANEWTKLDKATVGPRGNPPLVYDSASKRFMVLGGSLAWPDYPKPHPFDELALDLSAGQWENWMPAGKDWGPPVGDVKAPNWKSESWGLIDRDGLVRPNMTTYRGGFYYNQYAWDPITNRAYFFARGSTFSYDPKSRAWKDHVPTTNPCGKGGAPLLWGSMCADPVNKTILLFGGGNVMTDRGDPGTWTYDPATNTWSELKFTSAVLDGLSAKCEQHHEAAKRLAEALRARYYRADLPTDRSAKLDEVAVKLALDVAIMTMELAAVATRTDASAQEKLQIGWVRPANNRGSAALGQVKTLATGSVSVEAIKAADDACEALQDALNALAIQPPQRARSPMVYDAEHKQIVLFGGDQLDRLLADTWVFDCATKRWIQKRPATGPSPRGGHSLVYLPKAKKVLLFGGFGYTSSPEYCASQYRPLPFEMWAYDVAANRWDPVKRIADAKSAPAQAAPGTVSAAAADENDLVVALSQVGYAPPATWAFRADLSAIAPSPVIATTQPGVLPGAVEVRKGPFVPEFYDQASQPDQAAAEAKLKDLPANTWTRLTPPRAPNIDRCWGTAAYSPDHDVIMHWSGGHSSHGGTEVVRYHPGLDRWSLAEASEQPLDFDYSNDGTPGQWSFHRRPWMTGHTYHSYGYCPALKRMVFAGKGDRSYLFDPALGDWETRTLANPFSGSFYTATVVSTPKGAAVWANIPSDSTTSRLWRINAEKLAWDPLPLKGKLPYISADCSGMTYDSKRDRLLCFSSFAKGDVAAYDFASGEAKQLDPAGRDKATAPSRETAYLPDVDAVLIGARVEGGQWLLYDCGKNAWFGVQLAGTDPIGGGTGKGFHNSLGLMYDSNRKLIWTLGQRSEVTVLRFDPKSAKLAELK